MTAHHIRRYLVELHRRELSSQYQHDIARAIRAFLNYCVRDELLEKSPFAKVQMPRLEKKILEALTPDDIRRILKNCPSERDRALCLFLLDTGRYTIGAAPIHGERMRFPKPESFMTNCGANTTG